MSHKYYVSRIVHLAARDVWFKQMDGTWLPNIVVKLDLHAPKISLLPGSRYPGVYWSSFFHLCDRLLTYRHKRKGVNTAPHPAQFTQIISLCVANFSKELNRLTAEQFATKQPLPKIYLDIHTMLLRRLQSSWSNVTFTHVTHPRITAKLL